MSVRRAIAHCEMRTSDRVWCWHTEERRQRFKTASKRADTDCARAAERASNVASAVADSAAVAAAVATANAPPKKTPEVRSTA